MIRWPYVAALLLTASSAQAQEDWEAGLTEARLVGDANPMPTQIQRPQLVTHDHTTPNVIGGTATVSGAVLLVASWAVYVARQSYRHGPWVNIDSGTMDAWRTQGAVSFWLGAGGAASLVAGEYLLLPEARDVPLLAWLSGAAGLGVAAVGIGYAVGGSHCTPQALRPGTVINRDCLGGTSDGVFGPLLIMSAVPLFNAPLTYLLRRAFAGAPESLSFGPGTVRVTGRF